MSVSWVLGTNGVRGDLSVAFMLLFFVSIVFLFLQASHQQP